MNIRTRATAALALAALTASATLGACAGPGTATRAAPVPAVQQDATPAGLPDGALRGQVASTTELTLVVKNETDEVWNLVVDDYSPVSVPVNTRFASVLGPREANRAVINGGFGVGISGSWINAAQTANVQAQANVPLFGKDSFTAHVDSWVEQDRYQNVPSPDYKVTTSDIGGYTPTVILTISYAS